MDVKGAFLKGQFDDGEVLFMEVPEGFEKYYPKDVVLRLKQTIYGLKQAAMAFWRELLRAMRFMGFERNKADPCLYYKWGRDGLVMWISWVDDCLCIGPKTAVMKSKQEMKKVFDVDDVGEMNEYVGCKVERNEKERKLRLTQPVMLQSFQDEFELKGSRQPTTPAVAGQVLNKTDKDKTLTKKEQKEYRSGVGKLLHMMRWTRPDVLNAVRELSRFMMEATTDHLEAMKRVMRYCVGTAERGFTIQPNQSWNGDPNFEFEVHGTSDSEYAKDSTRKSVNGWATYLCGSPVSMRSKMMPIVALSVTEAELFAAVQCAQDMLFVMRIIESLGLKVKKPMKLYIDNKGAVDIANNWSVGGRTRHIEVKQYFLRDLKEEGTIEAIWLSGEDMPADMFTKNLAKPDFEKHAKNYVGQDKYYKDYLSVSPGESVTVPNGETASVVVPNDSEQDRSKTEWIEVVRRGRNKRKEKK